MTAHAPEDGTVMIGEDHAEVTFQRVYPTAPDDLWRAVTEPDRARRWLGALHGDLRAGGTYELRMGEDQPDAADVARGEVLLCEPPWVLELTWRYPGEGVSRLRVTVAPAADGAALTLVHTDVDAAAARDYGGGWHTLLDRLDDVCAARPVRTWGDLFDERTARYADAG